MHYNRRQLLKSSNKKDVCIEKRDILRLTFDVGLPFSDFRTTRSYHMDILFAHARDEWNNLNSAPFVIFGRSAADL